MMRSTLLWLMSRFVPEGDVFEGGDGIAAQHARRPVRRSQVMGLRLCGMALLPFWPLVNGSSASSTSVRWRWRNSTAQRSMLAPTRASVVWNSAVDVALDDLGGNRRRFQTELFADRRFNRR